MVGSKWLHPTRWIPAGGSLTSSSWMDDTILLIFVPRPGPLSGFLRNFPSLFFFLTSFTLCLTQGIDTTANTAVPILIKASGPVCKAWPRSEIPSALFSQSHGRHLPSSFLCLGHLTSLLCLYQLVIISLSAPSPHTLTGETPGGQDGEWIGLSSVCQGHT